MTAAWRLSAQNRVDEHRKHAEPWERGFSALTWERAQTWPRQAPRAFLRWRTLTLEYSLLPSAVFTRCILFQGPEHSCERECRYHETTHRDLLGDGVGGQSSGHLRIALYTLK